MSQFKPGDIIGFAGRDAVSAVIQAATLSLPGRGLSHVGIVGSLHGEPLIYESTSFGRPPCVRTGKKVSGVQSHRLDDMLKFVGNQSVWHYPLKRELYTHETDRLLWFLDSMIGRPYDLGGAIRSGGVLFNVLQSVIRRQNLGAIFCSEYIAAAFVDVGVWATRNASRWNPNKLVRALFWEGIIAEGRKLK